MNKSQDAPLQALAGTEVISDIGDQRAPQLAVELGLRPEEYTRIVGILGRTPTVCELYMYSLMWSEHCSYKHSKTHLRKFPTEGEHVLQGPGENAGVISVGDGWALAFKMESHNSPSAYDPYEGAATGIGGCMRDIFCMGARPIAALNSMHFGSLADERQRWLLREAVRGYGSFANTIGVPTIGGEVAFEDAYEDNCLVNAMGIGLMREEHLIRAQASGVGNVLVLIGATTGREGIGGASILASAEFEQGVEDESPTTGVAGDPELAKRLSEGCLELLQSGLLVGLGDLGAAGLTSSGSEMASRAEMGITIDVDKVPTRVGVGEPALRPFEVMVSESQERMLAVCTPENLEQVRAICASWDLLATAIGEVTDSGNFVVTSSKAGKESVHACIPARSLADDAPQYDPPYHEPAYVKELASADLSGLAHPADVEGLNKALLSILASSNNASRAWIYEQCKSDNLEIAPGADAGVIRIGLPEIKNAKGEVISKENWTNRGIAVSSDCKGRYVYLNPYRGAQIALAEAARNISCVGAVPAAITDCLNWGSPEKPEVYWTFVRAIEGLADACQSLDVPVISGNVSFYNESKGKAIYPTPAVGLVGLLDDIGKSCTSEFKDAGDTIILIGETLDELGGSEYLKLQFDLVAGDIPSLDLELEAAVQKAVRALIKAGLLKSAHDCSDGGIAVALVESAIAGDLGFEVALDDGLADVSSLFSESQSRVVVSCAPDKVDTVLDMLTEADVPFSVLGDVGGERIVVKDKLDLELSEVTDVWSNSLLKAVNGGT